VVADDVRFWWRDLRLIGSIGEGSETAALQSLIANLRRCRQLT